MTNTEQFQPRNYTLTVRHTPQHAEITLQANDRAYVGERITYRGSWMTVTSCVRNAGKPGTSRDDFAATASQAPDDI